MHIPGMGHLDISKDDPQAFKKVAREMEALFINELVKVMRKTVKTEGAPGSDIYSSMFDMELSRVLAERGLGLEETLAGQLSRLHEKLEGVKGEDAGVPDSGAAGQYVRDARGYNTLKNSEVSSDKSTEESLGGGVR